MLLMEAVNIKKYYGDRLIIGFDELKIYSGDRIGVTGINGSGKTTLLDMLYGGLEPDEGLSGDIARSDISGSSIRMRETISVNCRWKHPVWP